MEQYNFYFRLLAPLRIYFRVFKQIISIVHCKETSDKSKVCALRMLLISAEDEINSSEMEVIGQQFNHTEEDVLEAFEKVQAGPVKCHLYLN